MSHRFPNKIVLDPAIGKCKPYNGCPRSGKCATALVDGTGRAIKDYSAGVNNWKPEACSGWRDEANFRPDADMPSRSKLHNTPPGIR